MKQLHYFLACTGELTPQVVLYLVMVGKSKREQNAHAWLVRHCSGDNRFFYHLACQEVAEFLDRVRCSWSRAETLHLHGLIDWRSRKVSPCELRKLLTTQPIELLNGEKAVPTPKIVKCA